MEDIGNYMWPVDWYRHQWLEWRWRSFACCKPFPMELFLLQLFSLWQEFNRERARTVPLSLFLATVECIHEIRWFLDINYKSNKQRVKIVKQSSVFCLHVYSTLFWFRFYVYYVMGVCRNSLHTGIIIIIIIIIHEYYYGGAVALLLQDHLTMSVSRVAGYKTCPGVNSQGNTP